MTERSATIQSSEIHGGSAEAMPRLDAVSESSLRENVIARFYVTTALNELADNCAHGTKLCTMHTVLSRSQGARSGL